MMISGLHIAKEGYCQGRYFRSAAVDGSSADHFLEVMMRPRPVHLLIFIWMTWRETEGSCVRNCDPGYYSTTCNGTDFCAMCPRGSSCAGGCASPELCDPGRYAVSGARTNCSECPIGRFAAESGSIDCTVAPPGYVVPREGAVTATPCDAGRITATEGSETCQNCSLGRYTPQTGQSECIECPSGFECELTYKATPCEPGTYSLGNQSICTACPAGYACSSTGDAAVPCDDGAYSLTNWQYCVLAPAGFFVFSSALAPVACPAGTYAVGNATRCETCPQGRYTGTNVTGAARCELCPRGSRCPRPDEDPIPCQNGTFTGTEGAITCDACAPGRYAVTTTGAEVCDRCPRGSSCIDSSVDPVLCDYGYYSNYSQVACTPCDIGRVSSGDRTRCLGCPRGFECSDPTAGPRSCDPGSYAARNGTTVACTLCPPGFECPTTFEDPIPCDLGYYSGYGATNCTRGPAGFAVVDPREAPIACGVGNYSEPDSAEIKLYTPRLTFVFSDSRVVRSKLIILVETKNNYFFGFFNILFIFLFLIFWFSGIRIF